MNKIKVVAICGKTCSGKDTLKEALLKNSDKFHRVVGYTTRPPREDEKDGITYNFVSEEEFHSLDLIEKAYFNNWWYGTALNSFDKDKINLIILNPEGLDTFLDFPFLNLYIVFLIANNNIRFLRYYRREKDNIKDSFDRRNQADKKDFLNFEENYPVNLIIDSNEEYDIDTIQTLIMDNFN